MLLSACIVLTTPCVATCGLSYTILPSLLAYFENEYTWELGVVCDVDNELVVEVVVALWSFHLTQVRVDLVVSQKTFFVLWDAIAARGDACGCCALKHVKRICRVVIVSIVSVQSSATLGNNYNIIITVMTLTYPSLLVLFTMCLRTAICPLPCTRSLSSESCSFQWISFRPEWKSWLSNSNLHEIADGRLFNKL